MKVYCDSDTLFHNIARHKDTPKAQTELDALTRLLALRDAGKIAMFRSHLVTYEAMKTSNETQRNRLIDDYNALQPILNDEKLLGFNIQISQYTCINSPIISDVQDETIRKELMDGGLEQRDAEHITQAVCNDCDVFLTRDEASIIKPYRQWLEQRFPKLRVFLPSELLEFIAGAAAFVGGAQSQST
jgi:hypothetical protein